MATYIVDLRHLNSKTPAGKAVYTKTIVELLLEKNTVIGVGNNNFNSMFETNKNFTFYSTNNLFHHFKMVILAFKFKAQIFATESFITPLISSLLGIKNI